MGEAGRSCIVPVPCLRALVLAPYHDPDHGRVWTQTPIQSAVSQQARLLRSHSHYSYSRVHAQGRYRSWRHGQAWYVHGSTGLTPLLQLFRLRSLSQWQWSDSRQERQQHRSCLSSPLSSSSSCICRTRFQDPLGRDPTSRRIFRPCSGLRDRTGGRCADRGSWWVGSYRWACGGLVVGAGSESALGPGPGVGLGGLAVERRAGVGDGGVRCVGGMKGGGMSRVFGGEPLRAQTLRKAARHSLIQAYPFS